MKINKIIFLTILFFPIFILLIYNFVGVPENKIFFLSNFIIITLTYFGMFYRPTQFYSLSKIFYIFSLVFFGFVPLLNELDGNVLRGDSFNKNDKLTANFFIITGIIFFFLGQNLRVNFFDKFINNLPDIKKLNFFFFIIFIIFFIFILRKWEFNFYYLSIRGYHGLFESKIDFLFYTRVIRNIPLVLFIIFFYQYKKNKKYFNQNQKIKNNILLWFLFLATFLTILPTSLPRVQGATILIGFLIIFTKIWERPVVMPISIIIGLLILFPFLNNFRLRGSELYQNFFIIDFTYLKKAHFDSYQNFVRLIELDIITYGKQLSSTIFFFIPRSIWESKSIGSGGLIANQLDYINKNISMPFIAEGYINFGIIGLILFTFLIGLILGNLDRVAWRLKNLNMDCLFLYFYYFQFGFVFFLLRGSLINGATFFLSFLFVFWVFVYFLKFISKLKI